MSVLVGRQAPSFTSRAVVGDHAVADFSLEQFLGESYVVLLFYPKSFTGICQTELQAYNDEGQLEAPNDLVAYRATFLIDKQGQVMHQLVNHLPIGRDVDETLRMVDAVRHLQENGQACPANWRPAAVTA